MKDNLLKTKANFAQVKAAIVEACAEEFGDKDLDQDDHNIDYDEAHHRRALRELATNGQDSNSNIERLAEDLRELSLKHAQILQRGHPKNPNSVNPSSGPSAGSRSGTWSGCFNCGDRARSARECPKP